MPDDSDIAMPGQTQFSADEELAMRQASPTYAERYPSNAQQQINSDFGEVNSPGAVMGREGQLESIELGNQDQTLPEITVKPADPTSFNGRFNSGDPNVQVPFSADVSSFRASTNIEDDRNKPPYQRAIEYATKKPMAEIVEKVIHPQNGNRFSQGQAPWTPPGQLVPTQ